VPASPAACPGRVSRSDLLDEPPLWHTTPKSQQPDDARAFFAPCAWFSSPWWSLAGRLKTRLQGGKPLRARLSLVMTPAETEPRRSGLDRAEARQTALRPWRDRRSQILWGGECASRPRDGQKTSGWAWGDPHPGGALSLPWDRLGTRATGGGGAGEAAVLRPAREPGSSHKGVCQGRMGHVFASLLGHCLRATSGTNAAPSGVRVGWEETCR